jgi:hypothetical protein
MTLSPEELDTAIVDEAFARCRLKAKAYNYIDVAIEVLRLKESGWQPGQEVPADAVWFQAMLAYIRSHPMPREPLSDERADAMANQLYMMGHGAKMVFLKEEWLR